MTQIANAQCGLLLVSGNDTGFAPNAQSVDLANDDVAYTWSLSQVQANQYAIFQTHDPWFSTIVKTAITSAGYTYTVFAPAALTGFPFANYSVVILNWDDTDVNAFDPPYTSVIPALEAYVQNGGVVWIQGAIQDYGGTTTYALPFGGVGNIDFQFDDFIDNTASPLVTGVPNPFPGTYVSHASFSGYPGSSQVIVTTGTTAGGNTVVYTYQVGTGVCPPTATPMNTPTNTPVVSLTFTPTLTPTCTATNSQTSTPTTTNTPNLTWTKTPTVTLTPTLTPTPLPGDSFFVSKNVFSPGQPVSIFVSTAEYGGNFSLNVFNSAGEHIKTLAQSYLSSPIEQAYTWDGTNEFGDRCASGVYVLRLVLPFEVRKARVVFIH